MLDLVQKQTEDRRRMVLWLLAYDTDYTLGDDMLYTGFELHRKPTTRDQLANTLTWLAEQGFVRLEKVGSLTFATLTDSGLEIARGKSRAAGVRDLRPSEIAEINQAGF